MRFIISWDTDEEKIEGLPKTVDVAPGQRLDDVVEWLSDEFGWCVDDLEEYDPSEIARYKKDYGLTDADINGLEADRANLQDVLDLFDGEIVNAGEREEEEADDFI
eukprot:SAG11_NODE_10077_length_857_cov_3.170185_1_plen_106_part_00